MDDKLKNILEQALQESVVYIEKLNLILLTFGIVTIASSASLLYSFNVWTLICVVVGIVVIVTAILKKRQLFNDLTKLTESNESTSPKLG